MSLPLQFLSFLTLREGESSLLCAGRNMGKARSLKTSVKKKIIIFLPPILCNMLKQETTGKTFHAENYLLIFYALFVQSA
jgi:hypothetical protein